MITYRVEKYSEALNDLIKIYPEHYDELEEGFKGGYELEPNWESYYGLEQSGMLQVITCREDEELIGYMMFIVCSPLHVKSCLTALEDIYYLRKTHRKGRTGIKMFQFAEEHLKSLDVNRIMCSTKVHLDNSRLLEYLGYTFMEKLYSKFI